MSQDSPLGIAIVGLGYYSTFHIAPAIVRSKTCKLVGVITGNPVKSTMWRHKYNLEKQNIYSYANFTEIAKNKAVDIIYIVLPVALHAEYAIKAAEAGKHVICEKPMARTVDEAKAMKEACVRNNVKLAIGYRLHYDPHHRFLMGLNKSRHQILDVNAAFGHPIHNKDEWRLSKELAGGGALIDSGIYCIQAARYITCALPVSVNAMAEYTADMLLEDWIDFELKFKGHQSFKFHANYRDLVNRLTVRTSKRKYSLKNAFGFNSSRFSNFMDEWRIKKSKESALTNLIDDFIQCIHEDEDIGVNGDEGIKDLQIIDAIYKSVRSGKEEMVNYS